MAAGAPTSVVVEIELTAGVWTAVTTSVRGETLEIKVGREQGNGDAQPGTCSFDLDNTDGTYTPDNPLSSLYPNLVEGKRVRVVVTKGSPSTRFLGWIVVLEPELGESPNQSVTRVEATDLLGMLARMEPGSVPEAYAMANPDATIVYPCTETSLYETGAADSKGTATANLVVWDKDPDAGSIDSAGDSIAGNAGFVKMTGGKGLWTTRPAFPKVTAGNDPWSVSFLVKPEQIADPFTYPSVFMLSSQKWTYAGSTHLGVAFSTTVGWFLHWTTGATGSYSTELAPTPSHNQTGRWYHVTLSSDGVGNVDLLVNGDPILSTPMTLTNLSHVAVGGDWDMSFGVLAINTGSDTECYPARAGLAAGASGGATVSDVGDDLALAAGLASIDAGFVQAAGYDPQSTTAQGQTGLDMFLNLARGQGGVMYHEYSSSDPQQLRTVPRDLTRPLTVALTLDAEADLDGAPVLLREVGGLASIAVASSADRSATATDSSVDARVGRATVNVESTLYDPVELHGQASDALARTRDQKLRISQVTFDLWNATNDLYAAWFATSPGERVRVGNLPSAYLGVTYMDGYAAGWTERPMVTGYPVILDLDAADAPPEARFDTGRWAWGDGVCTASSLTAGATSVTLTWTGGQSLSTSAGDYPMDIDIAGERCTITSAPAGGSSPRTVTISRGVAPTVARAHAAGDPVEVWDAARWAF